MALYELGQWAESVEALAANPLAARPLLLPPACGDIIGNGIATYACHGLILGDIAAIVCDDNCQLSLVINLWPVIVADWRNFNGGLWAR